MATARQAEAPLPGGTPDQAFPNAVRGPSAPGVSSAVYAQRNSSLLACLGKLVADMAFNTAGLFIRLLQVLDPLALFGSSQPGTVSTHCSLPAFSTFSPLKIFLEGYGSCLASKSERPGGLVSARLAGASALPLELRPVISWC